MLLLKSLCLKQVYRTCRYDKIMANQDALNVFRQILAQGQVSALANAASSASAICMESPQL